MADNNGPLIPRPAVTLIALTLTFGLLGNVFLDATSTEYDGLQTTLIFASLVSIILGTPIGVAAFKARHGSASGDRDELEPKP